MGEVRDATKSLVAFLTACLVSGCSSGRGPSAATSGNGGMPAGGVLGMGGSAAGAGAAHTGGDPGAGQQTGARNSGGSAGSGAGGPAAGGGAGGSGPDDAGAGGAASGGGGAMAATSYNGCSTIGGIDRLAVAKYDASRKLCAVVVFANGANTSQVTLPPAWRVESAFVAPGAAAGCVRTLPPADAVRASRITGNATWTAGVARPYGTLNVDVVLHLGANAGAAPDEPIRATNIDVERSCP